MNLKAPISTLVAIIVGGIVLLGYFVSADTLPILGTLRTALLSAAMVLAGAGVIVGVANLYTVHIAKIKEAKGSTLYSFIVVASLSITMVITILMPFFLPDSPAPSWIFNYIQVPVEASLMAVLTVSLAFASVRLLNRRLGAFTIIFLGTVILVLLGSTPFGLQNPLLSYVETYFTQVLAGAGARGILIGVGLGTVATGLRILLGSDRPFGG
jgi:branched-subunit amino acid transport protein AzlD